MTRITTVFLVFVALNTGVGIAQASVGSDGIRTALKADDLAVVLAGETIYQVQCAACHGAQLQGEPEWRTRDKSGFLPAPPHDKTGHTWHHADDLLFEITKYGPGVVINDTSYQTKMPAYEKLLSDAEIIAVLSFIKHSWPEQERSWQDEVNGTQVNGLKSKSKKPSLLERLFK